MALWFRRRVLCFSGHRNTNSNIMFKLITSLTLLILLTACATVETNAYRVIGTTANTVDVGMKAWADQVVRRNIPLESQRQVRDAYRQYQMVMMTTSNAVAIFRTTGDKNQLSGALNSLSYVSATLINVLQPPVSIITNPLPPIPTTWTNPERP